MEILMAEHAGFCFGVARVISEVDRRLTAGERLMTYGPVIHNERVIQELEERGAHVLNTPEELAGMDGETLVIRAHGVTRQVMAQIRQMGLSYTDQTCPFVKRIHRIVAEAGARGETVVVAGDPSHPEVEGIVSYCEGPCYVIEGPEKALELQLEADTRVCLVAQTTFQINKFQEIVEVFTRKVYNLNVVDTVCNATEERQTEAARLAEEADAMIVIGGAKSSNTRKLFEICRDRCPNTYLIQRARELPERFPEGVRRIGITAGASTPNNTIEEVLEHVGRIV